MDVVANFDFDALHGFPPEGTLYRFVPTAPVGIAPVASPAFTAYLAADGLHVDLPRTSAPTQDLHLVDAAGREVLRTRERTGVVLPTAGLAPGIHLLRAMDGTAPVKVMLP